MTAAQLAKTLDLSRTTVSLVLNGRASHYGISPKTIERVLAYAKQMSYRPDPVARQLAGMRSNIVGVLVNTACIVDPRLIERMEVLAFERQIRFFVGHALGGRDQIRDYLQDFQARRVDAIVSFHHNNSEFKDSIYGELQNAERVLYYDKPSSAVIDPWYVGPDYYEMGRLATQHLVAQGRQKIGLIGLDETIYPVLTRRREGYEDALRDAGREVDPTLIWRVGTKRSLRWIEPPPEVEADEIVQELVVRRGVDGIFAVNDLYVARIMAALRRVGRRVPVDVALVGADNMDIGTLVEPQITTVDLGLEELAQATVKMLFEMLAIPDGQPGGPRGVVVKPQLIRRGSS